MTERGKREFCDDSTVEYFDCGGGYTRLFQRAIQIHKQTQMSACKYDGFWEKSGSYQCQFFVFNIVL